MCIVLVSCPITVDYESTTFEIDSDTQCIDVTIINDGVVEPMEEFTIEISAISPFVDIGTTSSAVVTITDDDSEFVLCCSNCKLATFPALQGSR